MPRSDARSPTKASYVVIVLCCLTYLVVYLHGEVNHADRGALVQQLLVAAVVVRGVVARFGAELLGDETLERADGHRLVAVAPAAVGLALPPNRGDYERIVVVGAGVSGMTVAHDRARIGYKVTVFEAHSSPGGMLAVGVPIYRLPRDLVQAEIEAILSLGVKLECNMRPGRDFSIKSLREEGYAAVFLGIGLPKGRTLDIPGAEHEQLYDGLDFLRSFNDGKPMPVGRRVVVIGGGNVAYDVARSAIRPVSEDATREESISEMGRGEQTAYDVPARPCA